MNRKQGHSGKVGVVGDENSVAGKGGGADDGIGKFQTMEAAQVKRQLHQATVFMSQCYDLYSITEFGKAGAIVVGKTIKGEKFKIRDNRYTDEFSRFKLLSQLTVA